MRFGLTFHLRKVKSEPDFLVACSLLIPKKLINDVGMLDEIYFAYIEKYITLVGYLKFKQNEKD